MDFNVESHLGEVERSVSALERDGQPARAVTLSRGFGTTVANLWDAVTNGDSFSRIRIPWDADQWRAFLPVSGDLKPGGHYQLEGNAGGVITACERPTHFALTWEFGEDISWVVVNFSDEGAGRARLTLTHAALFSEHWDEYGPGATGVGWELGLMGLALHLDQPTEPMPDEIAFATSPDGRAFITGSGVAWGQAAVEAGTDPGAAREAASRTTAFYTGESADTA